MALKLKYSKTGLAPFYEFIDPVSFTPLGRKMKLVQANGKLSVTLLYKTYKTHTTGFRYPASIIQKIGPTEVMITFEEPVLNMLLDDAIFSQPAE